MTGYHAILLAAGAGRRFGGRKLLAPWQGEPLVLASARIALAAPVDHCVAVVGCDGDDVAAALRRLGSARLEIVHAEDWADGLSASLRRGIESLPDTSLGTLVFLGDMPMVPVNAADALLDAVAAGARGADFHLEGCPAHPVVISRELYPLVSGLTGDQGARTVLRGARNVARLPIRDPGAVFDVDRVEDLHR